MAFLNIFYNIQSVKQKRDRHNFYLMTLGWKIPDVTNRGSLTLWRIIYHISFVDKHLTRKTFFTMSAAYIKRFEAVFLCLHPKGPKMSRESAAKYLKKSKAFVNKWVERYQDTKTVDDLPERGMTRKTTKQQDKIILQIFNKNPRLSLRQAKAKLEQKGINISHESIRNRLHAQKLKWRSTILKPLLSTKHVEKRIAWAQENIERDWSNVIFTDEASFWAWSPVRRTWCTPINRLLQRTVKHPVKVHVWGCFSKHGFGTLHLFTGRLDAKKMVKIYQKALLPSARIWFRSKGLPWILLEDNDPKHQSRLCKQWKADNGINRLDWPSQSPDANPIENVWAFMKMRLRGKKISNKKQLMRHIRLIWRSLSQDYATTLVESMPRRCQAIVDNDGDWTVY